MHLAELNIARALYPLEDRRMSGFVRNLDLVNGIAERSDGFVWRLKDETGNATGIHAFDDPMVISNLSVWRDAESLEKFVLQTVHKRFYQDRAKWFSQMKMEHFVMWFVPEGHCPSLREGMERLEHLNGHGNSDHAFAWGHLPHVKLWQQARCG